MAKTASRPEPAPTQQLQPQRTDGPYGARPLRADDPHRRTLVTRSGLTRRRLTLRRCRNSGCPAYRRPYRPEAEGSFARPHHAFGRDVRARLGRG